MTGFDPTAPARDTDKDEPERYPDNVVPPEVLTDDALPETDTPPVTAAPSEPTDND